MKMRRNAYGKTNRAAMAPGVVRVFRARNKKQLEELKQRVADSLHLLIRRIAAVISIPMLALIFSRKSLLKELYARLNPFRVFCRLWRTAMASR
jgi:hypothetical protein